MQTSYFAKPGIHENPNVSAGQTYTFTDEDLSTLTTVWFFWQGNMYLCVNSSITFTKWEGDGGNAEGTFTAEVYNGALDQTIMLTNGSFCGPIRDDF